MLGRPPEARTPARGHGDGRIYHCRPSREMLLTRAHPLRNAEAS